MRGRTTSVSSELWFPPLLDLCAQHPLAPHTHRRDLCMSTGAWDWRMLPCTPHCLLYYPDLLFKQKKIKIILFGSLVFFSILHFYLLPQVGFLVTGWKFLSGYHWCITSIKGWFSFGGKLPMAFFFFHMTVNFVKTLCGSFISCLYCPVRESWEC